ncbi:hypothetical protein HJ588_02985 [Flexivirga sp. ID2601S]|uniref:Uncharacterized protein n=1 Tax=Flexivirga aerilata TaxID=1656889 RepID=A0A849AG98_9MICO|nr:hypothetical protein [Flexivirga aerilata]NNG38238.1 hypothetical protein [Flexivirga aerilata]
MTNDEMAARGVPAQPTYVLSVRSDADGTESGWLDGERVMVPPGVGLHRALIQAARRRADVDLPGQTVRVVGTTPDGRSFHMAIDPDGRAFEVPAPQQPYAEPGPSQPGLSQPKPSRPVAAEPESAPEPEPDPDARPGRPPAATPRPGAVSAFTPMQPEAEQPVPDDVSHVAELREIDGKLVGVVDDDRLTLMPGDDPYEQLLRAARRKADTHAAGETVRVVGRTPDGRVWHIALAPDGTPRIVPPIGGQPAPTTSAPVTPASPTPTTPTPTTPTPTSPAAPTPTAATPAAATTPLPATAALTPAEQEPLTDEAGRVIPTTTTHASTAHDYRPDTTESIPREPDENTAQPASAEADARVSRRGLLVGGAGAGVLVLGGVAAFLATRGDDKPKPTPAPTGTAMPAGVNAPAGLPNSYLWSVVGMSDVAPEIVVNGNQLVCTTNNDATGGIQLVSLEAATGKQQWKSDLPVDAVVTRGPAQATIDGVQSVVVVTQSQILAWPMTGGNPKTWPVEQNWSTSILRSGVILTKPSDKASAFVLHGGQITQRALPDTANPVALLPDGTMVATNARGQVWRVTDARTAPKPTTLAAPAGSSPGTFVAATASQLITAFVPTDDPQASMLRSFALPTLQPRITTRPFRPAIFPTNFMLAPDQSWAVAGNAWVDMTNGQSHVIAAQWSPIAVSQYNSWSKSGDNVLTADSKGKSLGAAVERGGQVALPHGGTDKLAYCVASVGSDTTMYAVPLTR